MASHVRADPPTRLRPGPDCEPHTRAPRGYQRWHEWAIEQAKTHNCRRCAGCGLWVIWEPKEGRTDG